MAINDFRLIPSNIFTFPGPSQAVPDDSDFTTIYPIPQGIEYNPGQRLQFWDFTDGYVGFPSVTFIWERLGESDVKTLRQLYQDHRAIPTNDLDTVNTMSRYWLTRFNGETGQWEKTSGIMDLPHHQALTGGGDVSNQLRITFGRLGLHADGAFDFDGTSVRVAAAALNVINAGGIYYYGASDFADTDYSGQ